MTQALQVIRQGRADVAVADECDLHDKPLLEPVDSSAAERLDDQSSRRRTRVLLLAGDQAAVAHCTLAELSAGSVLGVRVRQVQVCTLLVTPRSTRWTGAGVTIDRHNGLPVR